MYAFKTTAVVITVTSFCLIFSVYYEMVAALLLILGIGMMGELSIAGTVFFEYCPPSKRRYLTYLSLFSGVGASLIAVVALVVVIFNTSSINDWRYIVGFSFLLEVVSLFFRFFMVETPAFCISKGNFDRAEKILSMISVKNTGSQFAFAEDDLRISQLYEGDKSSINDEKNSSLLSKQSRKKLAKLICDRKFLKVSSIYSSVWFI